jgi:hypothetical protein
VKGDWAEVNFGEIKATMGVTAMIGLLRLVYLIRKGKKFVWFDFILEPCLAVLAGMLVWGLTEVTSAPDVVQTVLTSLAAWGGPKTIRHLELKYFGGTREGDTAPGALGD